MMLQIITAIVFFTVSMLATWGIMELLSDRYNQRTGESINSYATKGAKNAVFLRVIQASGNYVTGESVNSGWGEATLRLKFYLYHLFLLALITYILYILDIYCNQRVFFTFSLYIYLPRTTI